ncbi:MAG TPA: flavodoxin family protein [Bacillota bacterium]|nr:flavodoxin family protein [Bacillota bacterium]HRS21822.1 flavodoxin family protein [Clostridia bacterium]HQE66333.1 flavodoxin family protein [Bacillota bacterium]HQI16178.1 flavodoxin family protein [Bacillota bacterium]HQJ38143.1 flavodoxin family protein [Bacillota bacterium]
MKALIVYDSVFGNTEQIAKAIGDSLADLTSTEVVKVSEAKLEQLQGTGLLIVGSPTRAFKPTKAIVDFLIQIPSNGLKGINVAAFDTRVNTEDVNSRILNGFVRIFGYAAKPIADKMQKKGGNLVLPPEGFFVKDNEGPLKDGELERAAKWAITVMKGE